ncbi:MAG: hypothetical protein SPF74_01935, partial [Candidatus Limivicinus sp.]|nr:hypothetical protein [Candidatus Limivicinus sp.]
ASVPTAAMAMQITITDSNKSFRFMFLLLSCCSSLSRRGGLHGRYRPQESIRTGRVLSCGLHPRRGAWPDM